MVATGGMMRGPGWALGGAHSPPMGAAAIGTLEGATQLDGAALSVALDVVQAWAVLITLGFTMILFFFLAMCVCAKKEDLYEDYESTIGVTTLKMCQDGGENGMRSFSQLNGSHTPRASDEASEASSRATLKRELPAIPLSTDPDPTMECHMDRSGSQQSSDLYAAVPEMSQGPTGGSKVKGGVQVLPTGALGPGGRAAILRETTPSSDSDQGDTRTEGLVGHGVAHPYAKVKKNHPYAHVKLPKKEHPYAKVGRGDSEDPETDTDNYDDPNTISKEKSSWQGESVYEPPPPVPEKRFELLEEKPVEAAAPEPGPSSPRLTTSISSAHSPVSPRGLAPTEPGSPKRSPSEDIPAAMAISGLAPANEELPYMTPPLHHQSPIDPQPNFSGDSQDSRGYTSISVREPLANLKAQGPAAPLQPLMQGLEGEGYYMTVSDDSADEMYACIYEGGQGGVGSETYAQIEPRTASPPPPFPTVTSSQTSSSQSASVVDSGMTSSQPPPAPPSVDSLRHVLHSRQASSSSAASTVIGSPGVEKRGTKSPLPPLPQGTTDLYSSPSPPLSPRPIERPTQRALEEMYAKVMKKQRPGHSRDSSSGGGAVSDGGSEDASSRRGSVDTTGGVPRWPAHMAQQPSNSTPRQSVDLGSMTHSLIETRNADIIIPMSRAKSYDASVLGSSWQHATPPITSDPNYETIPQHTMASYYSGGSSDHGYETVKKKEPPYASVEGHVEGSYPNYETVETGSREEPSYETLKHKEYEPGYETVQQATTEPSYESVVGQPSLYEPGYEMVKHEQTEAGYESVRTETKEDPGYEELKGGTRAPCTTSEHDPNYEQLKFGIGGEEPGYEEVSKAEAVEGTYECMKDYTTQYQPYEQTSEVMQPLYASVKRKGSKSPEPPSAKSLMEELEQATTSPEKDEEHISSSLVQPCAPPPGDSGPAETETAESVQKPPLPLTVSFDMSSVEERKQSIGSSDMDSPVKEQSSSSESPEVQEYPGIRSPIKSMSPDVGSPVLTKSPLLVDVGERPVSFTSIDIKRSPSIGSSDMESPDKPKSPLDSQELPESVSDRSKSPPVDKPESILPTFESQDTSRPTSMASPDRSRPTSMASPVRSVPTSIASPDKSQSTSVASPDRSRPASMASPDKTWPTSVDSPDKSRPTSIASQDKSRPTSMASPDRSRPVSMTSPDRSALLESGSPDRSRPVSVSSPDKSRPLSMGSPDMSRPLSVGSPDKPSSPPSSAGGPGMPLSAASPEKRRSPSIGSSDMDSPEKPSSPIPGSPEKVLPPPPLMSSFAPSPPPPEQTSSPPPPLEQISSSPLPPPLLPEEASSPPPPPPLLEQSPSPVPPEKIPSPPPPEKIPSPPPPEKIPSPPPPLESEPELDTSPLPPPEIPMPSEVPTRTVPSPPLVSVNSITSAVSNDLTDVRMESPEALPPPPHSSSPEAAALGEEEEFPPSPPEVMNAEQVFVTDSREFEPTPLVPADPLAPVAPHIPSSCGSVCGSTEPPPPAAAPVRVLPPQLTLSQVSDEGDVMTSTIMDLPDPPELCGHTDQDEDDQEDSSVSSGYDRGFRDQQGAITVTVNPMAEMDDILADPVSPHPVSPVSSHQPPGNTNGNNNSNNNNSSRSGSGSQDTGSGSSSNESVITVENVCISTTASVVSSAGAVSVVSTSATTTLAGTSEGPASSQESSSTDSSPNLDPNEEITIV